MYPNDNDETRDLPRVEPHQSWTLDQHPVDKPRQSPSSHQSPSASQSASSYQSGSTDRLASSYHDATAAFAVPRGHRVRGRYPGGYPQAYDEAYLQPRERSVWWRSRSALAVGLSVLALLMLGTAGFALLRDDDPAPTTIGPAPTSSGVTSSATPSAEQSPTPSPTASPKPTTARTSNPVPTAPPTTHPPAAEVPPAPVVIATPNPTCTPTYQGTNAPKAQVRDALVAAGAKQYWQGVQLPIGYVGALVPITVPANLMKAVAWQESGWQSAIMACDGGIGTMQVMAGTVTQINNRFGENYNPNTLVGNTELGANYLEWLIMYFGLYYYGQNFDLSISAPIGKGGEELALLDVVVAAYNTGPAALENKDNTLSVLNWPYVNNVEALMTSCECLAY